MRPVGPRSPQIYWLRRAIALAVAVVVLIGVVWFLLARNKGSGGAVADTSPTSSSIQLTGVLASSSSVLESASSTPDVNSAAGSSAESATVTSGSGPVATADLSTQALPTEGPSTAAPPSVAPTVEPAPVSTLPPTPEPAPAPEPPPTPTLPPPPSTDAQGRLLCPDSAITLTATTGAPSYRVGQQPILGLTVTNSGPQSCVRDLSGALQVFTVFSTAGERMWSTADCFPGQGTDIRMISPGQSVPYNIKWSATTSSPGCTAPRTVVPPGAYTVVAAIGLLKSPPKEFTITG